MDQLLVNKGFFKARYHLKQKTGILLFSKELLEEFIEVTRRPKLKRFFTSKDVDSILLSLDEFAEFIVVNSTVSLCRDPKDDFLLALAKDGNATHLLTGDQDLLELKKIGRTKILTISEYLLS